MSDDVNVTEVTHEPNLEEQTNRNLDPSTTAKTWDGHCPLLVDEASIDRRRVVETEEDAAGNAVIRAIHRDPNLALVHPVVCCTCGKTVERNGTVTDMFGNVDCTAAVAMRSNPLYKELFAAIRCGNAAVIEEETQRVGPAGLRIVAALVRAPAVAGMPEGDKANSETDVAADEARQGGEDG